MEPPTPSRSRRRPRLRPWFTMILITVSTGCAALRAKSELTVGQRKESTTTVAPSAGRDLVVGGGQDSIALWLAIGALGLGTVAAYPLQRKIRLWRANGKSCLAGTRNRPRNRQDSEGGCSPCS